MTTGTIIIENRSSHTTEIDIEGLIGIPEEGQFENPEQRVATYDKFKRQVEALRRIDTPEVVVNIRSIGGNVNDALLIHDTLCGLGKRITTRCYGYAASAATLIAQAASSGRREMSANSLYLIHQSISAGEGNTGQMAQTASMLAQTDRRIAELYAARSAKPVAGFIELMNINNGNGKWLSPREAKAAGLIDRIIGGGEATGENRQTLRTLNLPELPEVEPAKPIATLMREIRRLLKRISDGAGKTAARTEAPGCTALPAAESTTARKATGGSAAAVHDPVSVTDAGSIPKPENAPETTLSPVDPPARTEAVPTKTQPKEDPSPGEQRLSSNALSYLEDLRNFTHP